VTRCSQQQQLGIPLEGMFRYWRMPRCDYHRKDLSISHGGPIWNQRAYLNSGITPGKLKVALHGRFLERPAMG
jgi:hypothetical protein